jgi:16S rRNA (cytidine1402-2'-O)-methyltransferase
VQRLAADAHTAILYEAPHRIETLARELAAACGERLVTLCRELTKQFESVHTLRCDALPPWLAADANRLRGEFVLVLHAAAPAGDEAASAAHDRVLDALLAALPLKQAVALAVELTGAPRNALYERALARKREAGPEP